MYLVVPYSVSRQQKAHAEILNRFVLGEILVILERDSCKIVQIQVFEALCCKSTRFVCEDGKTIHLRGYPGQGHTAEPTKCLQRGPCILQGQLSAAKINSNPAMLPRLQPHVAKVTTFHSSRTSWAEWIFQIESSCMKFSLWFPVEGRTNTRMLFPCFLRTSMIQLQLVFYMHLYIHF